MRLGLNILLSLVVPLMGPLLGALDGAWAGCLVTIYALGSIDQPWDLVPVFVFTVGGLTLGGWLAMQIQDLEGGDVGTDQEEQTAEVVENLPDAPFCPHGRACCQVGKRGEQPRCEVKRVTGVQALALTTKHPFACHYRASIACEETCCCPRHYAVHRIKLEADSRT